MLSGKQCVKKEENEDNSDNEIKYCPRLSQEDNIFTSPCSSLQLTRMWMRVWLVLFITFPMITQVVYRYKRPHAPSLQSLQPPCSYVQIQHLAEALIPFVSQGHQGDVRVVCL